jgi:hypothetical protein
MAYPQFHFDDFHPDPGTLNIVLMRDDEEGGGVGMENASENDHKYTKQ